LRLLARREIATVGGKFTSRCTGFASLVHPASSAPKSAHATPRDLLRPLRGRR
jgi:hypothetical protein